MIFTIDVTKIFLSQEVQAIFDKFKDSDTAELTREEFNQLRDVGLVRGSLVVAIFAFFKEPIFQLFARLLEHL